LLSGQGTLPKIVAPGIEQRSAPAPVAAGDVDLLSLLRDVRRQLADRKSIPLYMVASNKTLEEIARNKPGSHKEMLGIHGMGPARVAQYGQPLIDAIRAWGASAGRG